MNSETISDLKAQVAANKKGIGLLNSMIKTEGINKIHAYMEYIKQNAESAVRNLIRNIYQTKQQLEAEDYMDDGTRINLKIVLKESGDAIFNFEGTGFQVFGNCNAPESVNKNNNLCVIKGHI